MSPLPETQARIRDWHNALAAGFHMDSFIIGAIYKANLDSFPEGVCVDIYGTFGKLCKDMIVALRPELLGCGKYHKLAKVGSEVSAENQAWLEKLLGSVRIRSTDSLGTFCLLIC